jgi:hypothetical protein
MLACVCVCGGGRHSKKREVPRANKVLGVFKEQESKSRYYRGCRRKSWKVKERPFKEGLVDDCKDLDFYCIDRGTYHRVSHRRVIYAF